MDITAVTAALATTKTILGLGKAVTDQKISYEILQAVAEMQTRLIDTQQQIMEIQAENMRLQDELRKAKDSDSIVLHHGVYWRKREDGEEGPFCPACWGLSKKLVLLTFYNKNGDPATVWCLHHGSRSTATEYSVPKKLVEHLTG